MHAYDKTRNLIEIRGRGVKIITPPHDHNLSYKDDTCHGKLRFAQHQVPLFYSKLARLHIRAYYILKHRKM